MKNGVIFVALLLLNVSIVEAMEGKENSSQQKKENSVQELAIIKPFFKDVQMIATMVKALDDIATKKSKNCSKRTDLIWSDMIMKISDPAKIIVECTTPKISRRAKKCNITPESICAYPKLKNILCGEILLKTFEQLQQWTEVPETTFAQIFWQRCCVSKALKWHQDPGKDFEPIADYSLILMLSDPNDAHYGWNGGKFKIRPGLPEDEYDESDVQEITHAYNQGILFNNKKYSHAVTAITAKKEKWSKRDVIIIPINFTALPRQINSK